MGPQKSRRRKRFPYVGEMVRMGDRRGLFLVMRIDPHERVADLKHRVGNRDELEQGVSFSRMRAVPSKAAQAIEDFLRS